MARTDEDFSEGIGDGIEKITDVLNEAVDKLYDLADSLGPSDEELEELNAGKTEEEIAEEDALANEIAAPIVNALDAATAEIYGMTGKVLGMTEDFLNGVFKDFADDGADGEETGEV